MKKFAFLTGAMAAMAVASAAQALTFTLEAGPSSTVNLGAGGEETFNSAATTGFQDYAATFGSITGTYEHINIHAHDEYGGAGGVGNYGLSYSVDDPRGYTLKNISKAVNFFGFYLQTLDFTNTLTFYKGQNVVGTFSGADLPGNYAEWNSVYVNIFVGSTFDSVVFKEINDQRFAGFESDNHALAFVPEPATWAMMIMGFGGIGAALRANRRRLALAA